MVGGWLVDGENPLETRVTQWAAWLERRGWAHFAVPWLAVLRVWGFVGAQVLWMLSPFSPSDRLPILAAALEQPDLWEALQHRLVEGGTPR